MIDMLKLQFVEVTKSHSEKVILEDLPLQTVGHDGDICPRITNGHLSRIHCTVVYYSALHCWRVTDGNLNNKAPSRNGLWTKDGNKIDTHVMMSNLGDRVYLLNIPGNLAYIDVIDDAIPSLQPRSTAGLEIQIAELTTKAEKVADKISDVKEAVNCNKQGIEQVKQTGDVLEAKVNLIMATLDSSLDRIEDIGSRPKLYLTGTMIATVMIFAAVSLFTFYTHIDDFVELYLTSKGQQITNPQKK